MSQPDGPAKSGIPPVPGSPKDTGEVPTPDAEATLDTASSGTASGKRKTTEIKSIGPYRLVRKLGEGGMGQVWLAEQTAPLQRLVALKLIRPGMYDDALLHRFQAERQSLAIMNHPCIAKIFDAGATPEGQPYFVMEYVLGLPITDHCDQKQLIIRERLELFTKVCEGVQHAHQKAIIHRDLKPANILVAEVDGKPTPRIIDFGIAKAVSSQPARETFFTQFVGGFVGTPGYMSPEQADPTVEDVDTRTDVYSLGVVLYVLLTGSLPFDSALWKQKPLHEVLRQLREEDPPRPSTKISTARDAQRATAEFRQMEPHQLVRLLRGDLDWITMKALEKDRSRRYDSCSALAMDVRRFLNNEPVLAAPPSLKYRAGKFIRRNRVAVLAASAMALMLVALAVSMTFQAVRIARERDRANREASAAKSVSDFLTGLFTVSDPSEARGNTITARQILDQGVKQIDAALAGEPEVQSRLMGTMGEVYRSLGLYKEAEFLLAKSVETQLRLHGPEHPDTLRSLYRVAKNLNEEGRYAEAETQLQKVLEVQLRVLGPNNPNTIETRIAIADVIYGQGRYQEAEKLYRELLDLLRHAQPVDDKRIVLTMNSLAINLTAQRRNDEAEIIYREVLDKETRLFGPDHPRTLQTMLNLGRTFYFEHKYIEAERQLRETLELQTRVLGPDHLDTLWSKQMLANTLRDEGRLRDAEELMREALAARERSLGPDHPDTLGSMMELAVTLDMLQQYAQAEALYRKAIEVQSRILGPDHPETAITRYNLACSAALQGKRDEAIIALGDALAHGLRSSEAAGIGEDEDFKSLRGDPRFEALVAKSKSQAPALPPKPD